MLELAGNGLFHAVEDRALVEQPVQATFGTRAVVTHLIDHERVVQLAHFFQGLDESADFVIGMRRKAGEDFHLSGKQPALISAQRVPIGQLLGLGGELRAGRNDTQRNLLGQRLLAQLVPTHVELAAILIDPLPRRVMRCVRGAVAKYIMNGLSA